MRYVLLVFLTESIITKVLINNGKMLFFIRCMTNFKKLSIFELLCINYNPN